MKTTFVTTTINVPRFLTDYAKNAEQFGYDADFIVVGDRKTPPEAAEFCKTIPNCAYLDLEAQYSYMSRFMSLSRHLPENSVARRNVGMLMAYERDAQVIVTLDDDNYAVSHDVVGFHSIVRRRPMPLKTYSSSSGWFNVCSFLEEKNGVEFYHRGYPSKQRWADGFVVIREQYCRPVVNAGFWLDNPDVDAITRMERELVVTGYKPGWEGSIALAPGTWSPFNCQNTAMSQEIIPAYFLSPWADRHNDILASFVVNRLTEHFGDVITFGNPLVRHDRGVRNLWKDLDGERAGLLMADSFCDALRNIKLKATSYHEGFGQITDGLQSWAKNDIEKNIVAGMIFWHEAFNTLGIK